MKCSGLNADGENRFFVEIGTFCLESHQPRNVADQFTPFGKELNGKRTFLRFQKQSLPITNSAILIEPQLDIPSVADRIVRQIYEQCSHCAGPLPRPVQPVPLTVIECVKRFGVPDQIVLPIDETDYAPAWSVSYIRMYLPETSSTARKVALVMKRRVEVQHPARISSQGVFPCGQSIRKGKTV